ncbi:MAG TPA: hypothetical protein VEJ36_07960 [Nitrososphaerales archaeon]|nr:hypothetical protein [Nitrososphaerales archaeon]
MKRKDLIIVCLFVATLALGIVSAVEYSTIKAAGTGVALATDDGIEVIYNLPGVAIPVPCCPKLVSIFVLGDYLFRDSSEAPPPPLVANGTTINFSSGVALELTVSALGNSSGGQTTEFVWPGQFNESVPTPADASALGGIVVYHWYTLDGLLYLHIET